MTIQTKYGLIEGVQENGYTVFKGVPYAKPPVGALRFMPPEEPEAWSGTRKADTFPCRCTQYAPGECNPFLKEFYSDPEFLPDFSEDCLYLNIWAPDEALADPAGSRCPVAFWIHGGGFGGGYSSEIEFDGAAYAKAGIILVTINYRVNIFGFLTHPWLDAENERGISGNYGILDQIAALRFVHENIAAFGGDPDNITIFGQSAGCMSCQVLLSSPLTKGLIAKAILQSGVACEEDFLLTPTHAEEEEFGMKMVEYTGAASLDELRSLPAEKLLEAYGRFNGEMMAAGKGLVVVPNVDGYVLEETVKDCWKNGHLPVIPYIAGCTGNDLGTTPEDLAADDPGMLLRECKAFARRTNEAPGAPGSYVYAFMHKLPGDDWGAFHTCETWYMFGTLGRCWRPMQDEDHAISERMLANWFCFMKTGRPDASGAWRKYTEEDPYTEIF